MANIKEYKKKDGSKAYQFNAYVGINPVTGKRQRTTRRGFKSVKEAKTALRRLLNEVEENGFQVKTTYLFNDVFKMWEKQYRPTVKEVTYANMLSYFKNHITPHFGILQIDKIDSLLCERITLEWGEKIPSLQRIFKSYTSKVFEYAINHGIIKTNPMNLVSVTKPKQVIKDDSSLFYSRSELNDFLSNLRELCNFKVYTFFRLLAYSGLRKGEAFALNWDDIDYKNKNIRINKTVTKDVNFKQIIGPPKTVKSNRVISIDQTTLETLKQWQYTQEREYHIRGIELEDPQLVFASPLNKLPSLNTATNWKNDFYKRYKKKHDTDFKRITTHGFRHTHASLMFEAGLDIKDVQDRLGHSDIAVTMNIYTHVNKLKKDSSGDKFASFMSSEK